MPVQQGISPLSSLRLPQPQRSHAPPNAPEPAALVLTLPPTANQIQATTAAEEASSRPPPELADYFTRGSCCMDVCESDREGGGGAIDTNWMAH